MEEMKGRLRGEAVINFWGYAWRSAYRKKAILDI
jgi:hypothetical protein